MQILITGVNGFVGQHLAKHLHKNGHRVIGVGQQTKPSTVAGPSLAAYHARDLTNPKEVSKLPLESVEALINLAGLAAVGRSFDNPDLYMEVNVKVLSVLCDHMLKIGKKDARIVTVSTGAVYDTAQSMPLSETSAINNTTSPYAASKLAMESAALRFRTQGLDVVIVRPFNHIGPGQNQGFLLPDLFAKISSAKDTNGVIKVGNLKTKRDYTDVRDIVRAYSSLALAPKLNHHVYNVCSGKSRSGQEILELLLSAMGLSGEIKVETDQSLIRPNDPMELYGSSDRLRSETGWTPSISLEQTIKDFVDAQSI